MQQQCFMAMQRHATTERSRKKNVEMNLDHAVAQQEASISSNSSTRSLPPTPAQQVPAIRPKKGQRRPGLRPAQAGRKLKTKNKNWPAPAPRDPPSTSLTFGKKLRKSRPSTPYYHKRRISAASAAPVISRQSPAQQNPRTEPRKGQTNLAHHVRHSTRNTQRHPLSHPKNPAQQVPARGQKRTSPVQA